MRVTITPAWRSVGAVIACVLLMPACGSDTNAAPTVLRWGTFANYQPAYIAVERGFFREAGVDVRLTGEFTSGPAVVQAAGTGDIDVGHSAIAGLANAVNSGIRVVGVADSQTESKAAPLMQWFVTKSSAIRDAADLKGKRIGTNTLSGSFYYTALEYLKRGGLTKNDVTFVTIPHQNQEQALASGQIDVAGVIDPYSVAMAQSSKFRVLFRAVDVIGARQFSLVFFRSEIVEKHPDVVERFLEGYRRAIEYIEAKPEESSRVMARSLGLPQDVVVPHKFTARASVRLDDVAYWLKLMRDGDELDDGGRLTAEAVATDQFGGGKE